MLLKITHKTQYEYDAPVPYGLQQVRLMPKTSVLQTVHNWTIGIRGGRQELGFEDQYTNKTLLVLADPGIEQMEVTVSGEVETHGRDGVLGKVYGAAPLWHFLQETPRTKAGPAVKALSKTVNPAGDTLGSLYGLSNLILASVPYTHDKTASDTTAEQALGAGGGVCQDHAQIFISAARHAGIPARYVSGYLMMDDQVDQDASHAWAEAHVDGLGWVAFDVSNGICPDERYVRIAHGRDSRDAAPISGMRMGNSNESMIVSLQVQQ